MNQRPLCLLALDGGGIRGLSQLLVLEEIMNRITVDLQLDNNALPCDFFDLIGGTSTGGLAALLLGRLRLSVPDARKEYVKISEHVFSDPKGFFRKSKFEGKDLENEVKRVLNTHGKGKITGDEKMIERNGSCKVFVCSVLEKDVRARAGPRLFRTYPVRENATFNCMIWEASRATSAAPTYFDPIQIGDEGEKETYVDAGLGYNNPIEQLLEEARRVFPNRKVACIVSIGTGAASVIKFPSSKRKVLKLIDSLAEMATESDTIAETVQKRFSNVKDTYFRFNVDRGLDNIELEEWKSLNSVRTYTSEYLKLDTINGQVDKVVELLLAARATVSQNSSTTSGPVSGSNSGGTSGSHTQPPGVLASGTPVFPHNIEELTANIRLCPSKNEESRSDQKNRQAESDQNRVKFLDDLRNKVDYKGRLLATPERVEGTCQWFCRRPMFDEWLRNPAGLLLASAEPGCGKSVLARYLIETVIPQRFVDANVCYFMFSDENEIERSANNAVRCLLHGLLESNAPLADSYINQVNKNSSTRELWDTFSKAANNPLAGQVICVLDALDECDQKDLKTLIEFLRSYFKRNNNPKVKFLLTTRGYPQILNEFNDFDAPLIHLSGETDEEKREIQEEIDTVMEYRLVAFLKKRPKVESSIKSIRSALQNVSAGQRTYLWLYLMFDVLEQTYVRNPGEWEQVIKTPPKTVFEEYEKLLRMVKPESKKQIEVLLGIILAAERTLTLKELNTALEVRANIGEFSMHGKLGSDDDFKEWLHSECGFFITVYDEKAYLIHQTAKAFLLKSTSSPSEDAALGSKHWEGSFNEYKSHRFMAESCVAFLSLGLFNNPNSVFARFLKGSRHQSPYSDYPFSLYCLDWWHRHLKLCQQPCSSKLEDDIGPDFAKAYWNLFRGDDSSKLTVWYTHAKLGHSVFPRHYPDSRELQSQFPRGYSLARTATILGHVHLLRYAIEELGNHLELQDSTLISVLTNDPDPFYLLTHCAAYAGSDLCLDYLLTKGWPPDGKDRQDQTALHIAFQRRRPTTIRLLLKHKASPAIKDDGDETPLYTSNSHATELDSLTTECSKILIDSGSSPNPANTVNIPLLVLAATAIEESGRELESVSEHLESLTMEEFMSDATFLSAYSKSFIRYLVEHGAELEPWMPTHPIPPVRPPLHSAALVGTWNVAFLLFAGANVNYRFTRQLFKPNTRDRRQHNKEGRATHLSRFIESTAPPHVHQVEELPLHAAIEAKQERAIRLLLKFGACVEELNHQGWTAISIASSQDSSESLQVLIDQGVDVSLKNADDSTPLHVACRYGTISAVKMLLPRCDIGAKDKHGTTALESCCFKPWGASTRICEMKEIIPTLLHAGAEIGYALHFASYLGGKQVDYREDFLALLIQHGADPRAPDENGALPLHWACAAGWLPSVLIESHPEDINAVDNDQKTPLHYICDQLTDRDKFRPTYGHGRGRWDDVVSKLLEAGSNPLAEDVHGETPLSLARKDKKGKHLMEMIASYV